MSSDPRIRYIDIEDIAALIAHLGIGPIRDVGLIESSLHRPRAVVFGMETYPDLLEKAAALLHSLARNHALFDGNKRIAWASMVLFLRLNGRRVRANTTVNLEFMLACARGDLELEEMTDWLRANSEPVA
jgi:death-on-curing protein